jgi:UTP--glucose-1-phosphate uridylyltransferase
MQKIRKDVIPFAGFGSRFLSATIAQPKEMLPIVNKPVIQYIVEEMVGSGIEEIVFITGRGKRAIEDHFDPSFELEYLLKQKRKTDILKEVRRISSLAKFVYVRQAKPLGNGHALLMAKEVIGDEPFAFSYGDDIIEGRVPAIKQMIQAYNKYQDLIVGVVDVPRSFTDRYGIVKPKNKDVKDKVFEITDIVEKPNPKKAPSTYASPGKYIFNPDIFEALEKIKPGKGGEIWVADAVSQIFKKRSIYACNLKGTYFDCGNKLEYMKAVVNYSRKHTELKKGFNQYLKGL